MIMTKKGFSLAEVLITLGIIGVVAVLTVSNLISKYNKYIIETNLKKTYADLNNMMRMAEAEEGGFESWDYTLGTGAFVKKYFAPYMHLTPCDVYHTRVRNLCFIQHPNGPFTTWYRPTATSKPGVAENASGMNWGYILDDGRAIIFYAESYTDTLPHRMFLVITVDVNGNRGRTIMGQDVFMFGISSFQGSTNKLKVGPGNSDVDKWTTEKLKEYCIKDGLSWTSGGKVCVELLRRNNWKFPKDYPIKF